MEYIHNLVYHALFLILLLSGPPIFVSMILGLFVAIFQAATQINEQTISSTFKLVAVVAILVTLGSWLGSQVIQFTHTLFSYISKVR